MKWHKAFKVLLRSNELKDIITILGMMSYQKKKFALRARKIQGYTFPCG